MIAPERAWAALLAAMRIAAGPSPSPAAAAAIAGFTAMPPAAREAFLLGALDDVMPAHLPPLDVGAIAAVGAGTVRREADRGGEAHFHERVERPAPGPAGTLAEEGDTRVAIATGLVLARSRTVRLLPADGTPPRLATATETRLLDP